MKWQAIEQATTGREGAGREGTGRKNMKQTGWEGTEETERRMGRKDSGRAEERRAGGLLARLPRVKGNSGSLIVECFVNIG